MRSTQHRGHWGKKLLVAASLIILFALPAGLVLANQTSASSLGEASEFSALELRSRWDMNEYSDISQAINNSGQDNYLQDIRVEQGVFSARSTGNGDAQFYALWPGYNTAILHGKVGHNYPIDARTYSCLYLAMQVDEGSANQYQVFWFKNEKLNGAGGAYGSSKGQTMSPGWRLYGINLANPDNYQGGDNTVPWTAQDSWQGLRIDPTNKPNLGFQIDWIRLTDCDQAFIEIRRNSGRQASVWVQPEGTDRQILVLPSTTDSVIQLDTQGLMPGNYTYLIKEGSNVTDTGSINIAPLPVADFVSPSFTSGEDYATGAGNPWDFSDTRDVTKVEDINYRLEDGVLKMTTAPRADAIVTLNTPETLQDPGAYRFLTFRLFRQGPWQNVPEGDIARLGWIRPGSSGRPGLLCHMMSQDIPYDVGWNTYTIDLHDPYAGSAEGWAGECGDTGSNAHWNRDLPVVGLRFDPNENITGGNIYQELDWIKLTQVDRVIQGQSFPIQVSMESSPANLQEVNFYYTNDRRDPTQHRIGSTQANFAAGSSDPERLAAQQNWLYLPNVFRFFANPDFLPVENGINQVWNTAGVQPGEYYICAQFRNSYDQVTHCSEAPVQVAGR